jgi:mono/diheme cytochrome c family protein
MNHRSLLIALGTSAVLGLAGVVGAIAQDAAPTNTTAPAADAAAPAEAAPADAAAAADLAPLTFSAGQAAGGKATYTRLCSACHGNELEGTAAPALSGESFSYWFDGPVSDLHHYIKTLMPADAPGTLTDGQVSTIIAYLAQYNGRTAGGDALPSDPAELEGIGFNQ